MRATNRRIAIAQLAIGMAAHSIWSQVTSYAPILLPIPDRPLRLVRAIDHTFLDQSHLSVFRSWQVEFVRSGMGINVTGEAVDVSVQASTSLAALAKAERARSTASMWPIRLSSTGLILAMGTSEKVPTALAVSSAVLDSFPDDLFYPALGPLDAVQTLQLPGGKVGEFSLHYEARCAPNHPWLYRAERRVITRIGSTQERVLERWTLSDSLGK